jgi:hypothetical protein
MAEVAEDEEEEEDEVEGGEEVKCRGGPMNWLEMMALTF